MRNRTRRAPRRRAAFTLLEVLLVLVILVMLGSMAVAVFQGTRQSANVNTAKSQVTGVGSAFDNYWLDMGEYPQQLQDMWQAPANSQKWNGPYLEQLPVDPWDQPYQYQAPGRHNPDKYDLWSNGPDKANGTEDDVGNWTT